MLIILIVLYIISFLFIVISGFNFYYRIPKLDDKIQGKEEGLSRVLGNHLIYQILRQTISITNNQYYILKEVNSKSDELEAMLRERLSKTIPMLSFAHTFILGVPPDEATISQWETLDSAQLNEIHSSLKGNYGEKMQKSINELNKRRRKILRFYTILQILGLFLNQVAIIITIIWKSAS